MADLQEVLISGSSFSNVLALPKKLTLGDIQVETSLEEVFHDTLQITEHPVDSGALITDHSFKRPAEVHLQCGWSNSSLKALVGIVTGFFSGGSQSDSSYVGGIYSRLLALQESRKPFSITTTLRKYDKMLITALQVTRDQKTSQVLLVSATCRQVIIVSTKTATLPPKENQANPQSTAETENAGPKQLKKGSPSSGGAVPADQW